MNGTTAVQTILILFDLRSFFDSTTPTTMQMSYPITGKDYTGEILNYIESSGRYQGMHRGGKDVTSQLCIKDGDISARCTQVQEISTLLRKKGKTLLEVRFKLFRSY